MAAGDYLWVKATVAANTVGTKSPTNATAFADPYGIQAAFDNVAAGEIIRILADGTNQYDDSSTSWTNRDDTTKKINIDTTSGTLDDPIIVEGMTGETTEGEAILDFAKAAITGSHGFHFTSVTYYIVKDITIRDCDSDGFHFSSASQYHTFIRCHSHTNSGHGWASDGAFRQFKYSCSGYSNSSSGVNNGIYDLCFCEFYANSAAGCNHSAGGQYLSAVCCIFDDNTGDGHYIWNNDFQRDVNCTYEDNTDGWDCAAAEGVVHVNCGFTNNTTNGCKLAATDKIYAQLNCGYNGNGTDIATTAAVQFRENEVTTSPTYTNAASRDYSIGTNWKALGVPWNGTNNQMPSGDFSSYVDIGIAQREEPAGGGGSPQLVDGGLVG